MRARIRLLLVVAAGVVLVAGASADGDPASDVLGSQDTFMPYPSPSPAALKSLVDSVHLVDAGGDRVKVAVIATKSDMGAVSSLFGHAPDYAKFLGIELSLNYKGPLLVVMPSGFGFTDAGHAVPAADAVLARVTPGSGADGLTFAAAGALPQLEHAGLLHYNDTLVPQAYASAAKVIAGRRLALRYQTWDDSGRVSVDLQIRNAQQAVIVRFHVSLRTVRPGAWYWVVWRVPLKLAHHTLATCVRATDPSGNRSHLSCATLVAS